jgi:tyrosine-protein phosphatase non-receptor type 1
MNFYNFNFSNRNKEPSNELRHRQRTERNEAMKDKIREIKRKTKEAESWPKKRRSLLISIISGVLILSFVSYFYTKS